MKKILGLDLGTNSIGWSVVNATISDVNEEQLVGIESAGSRIIPMDATQLGEFAKGNIKSPTNDRTQARGTRRLFERNKLRRERLLRVLSKMGFLPEHFDKILTRYGKLTDEVRLPWHRNMDGRWEFIFQNSYNEMLSDFQTVHPEQLANGMKVPYDWTVYYLRKKALTKAISKEELAWLLLQFNAKRGYYQLRGEEEETSSDKQEEYMTLKVLDVADSGEKKGKDTWFDIKLENDIVYRRALPTAPDWIGTTKEFIITTTFDKKGNIKKKTVRLPKEDDWTLLKKRTEAEVTKSEKTIGEYIYDAILANPQQKIKGKLVRVVERKFYEQELRQILKVQSGFIAELQDYNLYSECIKELYPSNDAYRASIANRDFVYLLKDDIIFYQRPLKSKKSLIDDCPYESHKYIDKKTGEERKAAVKCIAKSHPLYQEFRLWQFVHKLKIYEKEKIVNGRLELDYDVTSEFLPTEESYVSIFDVLNDESEIKEESFFTKCLGIKVTKKLPLKYRWNYVSDKFYPCNETRASILSAMEKAGIDKSFLTKEREEALWHILYSVDGKQQLEDTLRNYAEKNSLPEEFIEVFLRIKPFEKSYGAYSAKAIKRLLPLMRMGKYWHQEDIDSATLQRLNKIIDGEYDETITDRVREKIQIANVSECRGMPLWKACYAVYGCHSEVQNASRWTSPDDIDTWLKGFKQHSMRNPIVEQVVTETMRTVRDIWKQSGRIDEIHIEMGRELKQTAAERARRTSEINDNENRNIRIKALLAEFLNSECGIEDVRPYSPSQQEVMRIYEDYALSQLEEDDTDYDFISRMSKTTQPTPSEVMRYKLWLDQKYISPYTGETIPLSKLFTSAYEIEHIIPQSRFFDDSFSNKVICESEVNKLKDNQLGLEFIRNHHGEKVQLSQGKTVTILSEEEYEQRVKREYAHNRGKMKRLLMDDIPDGFIERQMNDSRYIARFMKSLLSNIVREEGEDQDISKNVITTTGAITDRLKKEWGIGDVWNNIILPRFQRLNELTGTHNFTAISTNGHEIPVMPLDMQKGFSKKRIDHRHHAMDAIVIACTTRNHVNLLNNEAAMAKNKQMRYQLSRKLRHYEDKTVARNGKVETISVAGDFIKPWSTFTQDTEKALRQIIVSFKQNLRVINKTKNHYVRFVDGKKTVDVQNSNNQWAIRKPLHKDTVFAEVNLQRRKTVKLQEALKRIGTITNRDLRKKLLAMTELGYNIKDIKKYFDENKDIWSDVNLDKIEVIYYTKETNEHFYATRKPLDTSFDKKKITESVTDTAIQKILLAHLEKNDGDASVAFSPDGIEEMNRNIIELNDGRNHKPIYKVRQYEKAEKFAVGQIGNKSKKYVEAAKGTNLFFAIYETELVNKETGEVETIRSFDTIPLNIAIDRMKKGLSPVSENENGNKPAFVLSPDDLVYVPTEDERKKAIVAKTINKDRVYKMVSANKAQCFFIKENVSMPIVNKVEYSSANKMERAITNEMIKNVCIPIKVDRLGNITEINGQTIKS